jgi:OmcA/MtrC family decaheme c-type cytochrome
MLAAMAGCGGGGGGGGTAAPVIPANQAIASASAIASNDTSINTSASFTVLQDAGVAAVTINSPPVVNFTVFSDGAVKTGLTTADMSFAIAKLVPGIAGEPDQWVNYIYRKETAAAGVGPGGLTTPLATAWQATTDAKQASQLTYNPDGYYTYTFKTDIKNTAQTNGVVFEPNRTHRVAIQLSYKNAAGETVRVNPYIDFTIDANGRSVLVTDPAKTRKMTDVSSCNGCHEKLALHGGGRVDTQYCVMCHNPGTTDANSGNVLTLSTMVHKIHAGKLLHGAAGGEDYTIWGYGNSKHSYAEVGFPQDLRNCSVCHSGANPKTPQGDNWKTEASKGACLTCHASNAGSAWELSHKPIAVSFLNNATAQAKDLKDGFCAGCHAPGTNISPERVHWNQNEENAAKYKMNIESAVFNDTADKTARTVSVTYSLTNPLDGKAYDLASNPTKFGSLRFILAYQNMTGQLVNGQPGPVTEFSAYNNGGNTAAVGASTGVNLGNNRYTVNIAVPNDTATAIASGTARVVSYGQIKENKLDVQTRLEVSPVTTVNVVVQHTYKDVLISGSALNPRRVIVSNEKCNVCHGALGTTSGSNTLANAFHSGARNTVEACVVCHDANRMSSTIMTNGSSFNESYQFKRMIHGIHGNSKRASPFTHGNKVVGIFCNPAGTTQIAKDLCAANDALPVPLVLAADVENYAAEVAYPGVGLNCNACHVNNSYKQDLGTLGAVIKKDTGVTDPNGWKVISPKVASCTACHDSAKAIDHVTLNIGDPGAVFGTRTQAELNGLPAETCNDCHAPGARQAVDLVHGQK